MSIDLTGNERHVIREIAVRLSGNSREQLLADLELATVSSRNRDGSRVGFQIGGYSRPTYRGQHPFPVEARVRDSDGSELSVILYADEHGRLLELELVRFDDGEVLQPDWKSLTVP